MSGGTLVERVMSRARLRWLGYEEGRDRHACGVAREPNASVSHPTGAHLSWEGIRKTNQYNAERVLLVR